MSKLRDALRKELKKLAVEDVVEVRVSGGFTANVGNYESARYDCSFTIKTKISDMEKTRTKMEEYITDILDKKYEKYTSIEDTPVAEKIPEDIKINDEPTNVIKEEEPEDNNEIIEDLWDELMGDE